MPDGAKVNTEAEQDCKFENLTEFDLCNSCQSGRMLLPDQHVAIQGHENVADVRAHFHTLPYVAQKYDFEILSELSFLN